MKYSLMAFLVFASIQGHSQELVFSSGLNTTKYDYKDPSGQTNENLNNGIGNFYEIGYTAPIGEGRFHYSLGVVLNEYNAKGGTMSSVYSWRTKYLGIQGGLSYIMITSGSGFKTALNLALQTSSIISGEQGINGAFFDLSKQEEFRGIFLQPIAGIDISYPVSDKLTLALGYNYSKSSKFTNRMDEVLNFSNNQWQIRLQIALKEKNDKTEPTTIKNIEEADIIRNPERL
ncbi:hypothetical protein [uncultured Maribacter sp.]|uniref:hypothetical protein n=1 Tax=uncultured Maribacter sp. TaxID=431308 RepID=UPI0030D8397B|tara:strand:+ start:959 stop:1651 length:693 start_codon:yes stop_codon:yes gene_type:complete